MVFTPYARLTHHESGGISQRQLTSEESAHLRRRWGPRLDEDPYYNPNLSRVAVDYRVDPHAAVRFATEAS